MAKKPASTSKQPNKRPVAPQSAAGRREAEVVLRELVAKHASQHLRLINAARKELRARLPNAAELVYEYRAWLAISFSPSGKGHEGVLAIRADAGGVKLYFTRGTDLDDPAKVLRGTAQTRWVLLEGLATLKRPEISCLMDRAISLNRVPFALTGAGPLVIQSASK